MEARSLASLNLLAGNPPQYPVNPAEAAQDALTLYISRVPGTRDVIFSPFKPQLKNVTAEDVASSLYYIHLEMPRSSVDLGAPQAFRDDEVRSSSEDSGSARAIPRKPLPQVARPMTPDSFTGSPGHLQVPSDMQGGSRQRGMSLNSYDSSRASQAPQGSSRQRGLSLNSYSSHDGPPPAMATQPTHDSGVGFTDSHPLPHEPYSQHEPNAYAEPIPPRKPVGPRALPNLPPPTQDKSLPNLPPNLQPPDRGHFVRQEAGYMSSRSPSPKVRGGSSSPNTAPFTLNLIRRDPSSGNQWNVGRISSHETESPPMAQDEYLPARSPPPSIARPPIDITIETSGYAKFRNMPVRRSLDTGRARALSGFRGRSSEDLSRPPRNEVGLFSRQVVMAYSKSWTSTLKDKWAKKSHGRNKASVSSVGSAVSASEPPPTGQEGMRPRGYVFTSPWDGRCEFRTGNGGRSVRCHHILHEASSFNPLVEDQESQAPKPASSVVSELRFNLPSSELFGPSDQDREPRSQWRGHFSKLLGTGEDEDDAVSPFEVNVGAERAGGGNRGKRAKLGKLIIYNDGLKMLDLVVAANAGVWWGAWEKNF